MKKRLRLIFIAFSVSFAIMAALSLFALKQFASLVAYSDQVDHTNEVITRLYQIETFIKEVDVKERGYMVTHDSVFIKEIYDAQSLIIPATDSLRKYIAGDRIQNRTLTFLRDLLVERRDVLYSTLKYLDTAKAFRIPPAFYPEREMRKRCLTYIDDMRKTEDLRLHQKFENKKYYQQIAFSTMRYLLSIFAGITILLFLFMMRELRRRMSYQDELQINIADLRRSHNELEQIAFAVSHHLQEPLRKIQVFSNRMLFVRKDNLDTETSGTLERINNYAARMQELIDDLMDLTSLVKEESMEEVNLNEVLNNAIADLEQKIQEKNASIQTEALPEVKGHPRQIQLLFKSILDNSIKFSKDEAPPVISIRCDRVNGSELKELNLKMDKQSFHRVTIADNGIGFDNKFISKMFRVFQRLHNDGSEYTGKGMGLAICQRIMVNHGGYILAHGRPGAGATFRLYFPIKD